MSLLDERRWAELGVVRASDLAPRGGTPFPSARRSADRHPRPTTETVEASDPAPVAPPAGEDAAVLPVAPPLAGLLPWGGLRRGSAVAVTGSTALVLALLAEASRAGSWCALVGWPALGVQAAAEAGLDLGRTALVPEPGPRPAAVVAALVDGIDVVVLGDAARWSAGDRQRLDARVRQRGAVLVPTGPPGSWPGADAELGVAGGTWTGLGADGPGRLRSRRVRVRCAARGRPERSGAELLLPGPDGRCVPAPPAAPPDALPAAPPAAVPPRPRRARVAG